MYSHDLHKCIKDLCRRLRQNYLVIKPTRVMISGKEYVIDQVNPDWFSEVVCFNNSADLNTKITTEEENQRIWDAIEENFKQPKQEQILSLAAALREEKAKYNNHLLNNYVIETFSDGVGLRDTRTGATMKIMY